MPVLHGSVISRFVMEDAQYSPLGRFLALTPNDELNALAAMQYQRTFSRTDVFQLAPDHRSSARQEKIAGDLRGRVLFSAELTYGILEQRARAGHAIKKTALTAEFTFQEFFKTQGADAIPLFLRTPQGALHFFTAEYPPKPAAGDFLFSLAPPKSVPTAPEATTMGR